MARYARLAGVLFLLSMIGGGLGEAYVPGKLIVSSDAALTAANLKSSDFLFRLGFAAYLLEAICDIGLAWVFYVLLRPVHRELALLAAFFGLVSTAVFGFAELFYLASSQLLRDAAYLKSFSIDQRNTLALLSLKTYTLGAGAFMALYGIATLLRGYLIFRSGYLPKFLGVLFALAGFGFIARNFLLILAPQYDSPFLLLPMFLAGISATVWFLAKGVKKPIAVALCTLFVAGSLLAGEGIGGVEVGIRKKPGTRATERQTTAKDGSFTFKNLSVGSYVISISAPPSTNPNAKSFFESRSNMRITLVTENADKTRSDPEQFEFVAKDGALAAAKPRHDVAMNSIRNIRARQARDKPNEITVDVVDGQSITGKITMEPPS